MINNPDSQLNANQLVKKTVNNSHTKIKIVNGWFSTDSICEITTKSYSVNSEENTVSNNVYNNKANIVDDDLANNLANNVSGIEANVEPNVDSCFTSSVASSVKSNVNSFISHAPSPHFTPKEDTNDINLLVVHNISLPPKQFGGDYITDFFLGKLDKQAHPYFETIYQMKVSAHCLIKRDGRLIQYVSFLDKAWHAGVSSYKGREMCNDFSIGIELEGADDIKYTEAQYKTLALACVSIKELFPQIKDNIAGHNQIAPTRKTDPGEAFNWSYFYTCLLNAE